MKTFFKMFFATLLALIVFGFLSIFFFIGTIAALAKSEKPVIVSNAVLTIDLAQAYNEKTETNPLGMLRGSATEKPGLYKVIKSIQRAKNDPEVKGIYLLANGNANGFATSEEIRNALLEFKQSGKFLIAYGDVMSQKAYSVATAANKIFLNPKGFFEWDGYQSSISFIKGTLDKLGIEPQIFYAGKFKSATEPLRVTQMTPENKLQTSVWLNDLYDNFLITTSVARNIDTALLRSLAMKSTIQKPEDAITYKLIDGLKYDDEIRTEIKKLAGIKENTELRFVSIDKYAGTDRTLNVGGNIAMIYAEGDIVDGKGDKNSIGSDKYVDIVRKARENDDIKAIVFRINSGGGSVLASEKIWRELSIAKKKKPVVVSFGDVAASGGYYVSCDADSIFAMKSTITGSIGVFGILFNMQKFYNDKLGITFDGVKTAPGADMGASYRPLSAGEKVLMQNNINDIYSQFKKRVSDGRKKDTSFVEGVAQGRVWTGIRAKDIGLIDRWGGIEDAIRCAAKLAKLNDYSIAEYPEADNIFKELFEQYEDGVVKSAIKNKVGEENYNYMLQVKRIKESTKSIQARLPFDFTVQ